MSEPINLTTTDGVRLQLRRYSAVPADGIGRETVLLLHGASANHATFTTPRGGLAAWLTGHDFDVWLLDWRGSSLVVDDNEHLLGEVEFTFNTAAERDLPAALSAMREPEHKVQFPIAALGHCMGSTVLAETIALGHVNGGDIDRVVLVALGLFYEAPLDSRIKSEERILEQLRHLPGQRFLSVDPRVKEPTGELKEPWPGKLEQLYKRWPGRLFHAVESPSASQESDGLRMAKHLCNRLSFMYGMPYDHSNLVDDIHGTPSVTPVLGDQFGAIPLDMFIHAARNLRQGHSTFYQHLRDTPPDSEFLSDRALANFKRLTHITLVTGAQNRLWHRNSIDLMYEWLKRPVQNRDHEPAVRMSDDNRRIEKRIFTRYAHQDLLWGKKAEDDVFPTIEHGLRGEPAPAAAGPPSAAALL